MIVTLSGAGCTGKTTLLNFMKDNLGKEYQGKNVSYHEEFIRNLFAEIYQEKYNTYEDLLLGDIGDILDLHRYSADYFDSIMDRVDDSEIAIFDRAPLDISAYLFMNYYQRTKYIDVNNHITSKFYNTIQYVNNICKKYKEKDPLVFYTTADISIPVKRDGFRPIALINNRDIEIKLFDLIFTGLNSGTIILPNGVEKRYNIITDAIDSRLKGN